MWENELAVILVLIAVLITVNFLLVGGCRSSNYSIIVGPKQLPDMAGVQALYESHCASCHGIMGYGDGPLAKGMEPPPGDFHDMSRQYTRSIYDLYNTITLGVPETPMTSFAHRTA